MTGTGLSAHPSRVLVRMPNWLGDVIMALPALAAVRAHWADASLALAVPRSFASLAAALPGVDGIVALEGRGWRDRAGIAADLLRLQTQRFDTAILFTNSYGSARVLAQAGIPERWGYRTDFRGRLLTRGVPKPHVGGDGVRHHARYYGHLVEQLGCEVSSYDVRLAPPLSWQVAADALLSRHGLTGDKPLAGFAPGAAYGTAKRYPPSLIGEVIARVEAEGMRCVLVGTAADREAGREALARLRRGEPSGARDRQIIDVIGETDLTTLAGLMTRCAVFVSNDSGAMHLASAMGVPTVAIFGATDERATAPLGRHAVVTGTAWCRPCLRRECPIDHRCMWSIPPERVVASIAAMQTR